jgi:hypothetical protein
VLALGSAHAEQLVCPAESPASSKLDNWEPVYEGRLIGVSLTRIRSSADNKNTVVCRRSEGSLRMVIPLGSCVLSEGSGKARILYDSPEATLSVCELPLGSSDNSIACLVTCKP